MAGPKANRRFLTTLGWVPQLMLNGAVFFLFAILGFFIDLSSLAEMRPWGAAIAAAVLGGLVSLGYLQAAMRGVRWVPLALVWQGLLTLATARLAPHRPPGPVAPTVEWLTHRARLDGVGIMVCVVVAYTLFIAFITRQGVRGVRLGTEIGLARDIQRGLVPALDRRSGRLEVFGEAMPSSEVGGDLIDLVEHPGGTLVCVADVSGHGVPAGTLMAMVRSAIRMRLMSDGAMSTLLEDLNRLLFELARPDKFVTFAGLRFLAHGGAEVGLAGHPPILLKRPGDARVSRIDNQNLPLGVQGDHRFRVQSLTIEPGDLLVLFTDGIIEVSGPGGREFGIEGIERILSVRGDGPLPALFAEIRDAARRHGPATDDQTLLLVRVTAPAATTEDRS